MICQGGSSQVDATKSLISGLLCIRHQTHCHRATFVGLSSARYRISWSAVITSMSLSDIEIQNNSHTNSMDCIASRPKDRGSITEDHCATSTALRRKLLSARYKKFSAGDSSAFRRKALRQLRLGMWRKDDYINAMRSFAVTWGISDDPAAI